MVDRTKIDLYRKIDLMTSGLRAHTFRAPVPEDFEDWFGLYQNYAVAVRDRVDRSVARIVWGWFMDPHHPAECVIVSKQQELVGFAHFRPFPRTLHANEAGYLDDVYISEEHRGIGLARQLIEYVAKLGKARGWSHLRWVTFEDNQRAIHLYERIAKRSDLLTYVMND